jgi:hypothetical protein
LPSGGAALWGVREVVKNPEQGIGHPDSPATGSRASNHLTDQTWTDPGKAVDMAHTTLDIMVDYRFRIGQVNPIDTARLKGKWTRLEPIRWEFAKAKTKKPKKRWLDAWAPLMAFSHEDLDDMTISNK